MLAGPPDSQCEVELDNFLRASQHKALAAARLSVPESDAMDCVQAAMFKFVRKYRKRPAAEWRPLFFRVLYNELRDWHRKTVVRKALIWPMKPGEEFQGRAAHPERWLASTDAGQALIKVLGGLPLRQQQAFVLRHWEGLDTRETGAAMGISTGSVKVHLSRAMARLRAALESHHEP